LTVRFRDQWIAAASERHSRGIALRGRAIRHDAGPENDTAFVVGAAHGWPRTASRLCGRQAVLAETPAPPIDRESNFDRVRKEIQCSDSRSMDCS
jgi:hypothetical protein